MLKLIQLYFQALSAVAPTVAAKSAFNFFQRTRNRKIRLKERQFMQEAHNFKVPHHHEDIDCYELGNPEGNLVLLVHGWESNAGSMGAIAYELVDKGFHVVAFNLPAHGFSKLKKANLKVCQSAMRAVLEYIQPSEKFSIVSHSFGSAVTAYSLAGTRFQADKIVFLTNPNKLSNIFREFARIVHLGTESYVKMCQLATDLLGERVDDISVEDKGKQMQYNKILMVHDRYDRIIPYHNSVFVRGALRNSRLITLNKVGHYKMLWNKDVIQHISDFLCVRTISIPRQDKSQRLAS